MPLTNYLFHLTHLPEPYWDGYCMSVVKGLVSIFQILCKMKRRASQTYFLHGRWSLTLMDFWCTQSLSRCRYINYSWMMKKDPQNTLSSTQVEFSTLGLYLIHKYWNDNFILKCPQILKTSYPKCIIQKKYSFAKRLQSSN